MRLNPWILVATLLVGATGLIFLTRAFVTYLDAAETFTEVELLYVRDSFAWSDPEFEIARAEFRVVNASDYPATVENFGITLQFNGLFAGSDYTTWEPLSVPAGETREISALFTVTANSIQDQGGTADLSFTGQLRVTFAQFEEPLVFRFVGQIGTATYE